MPMLGALCGLGSNVGIGTLCFTLEASSLIECPMAIPDVELVTQRQNTNMSNGAISDNYPITLHIR